MRTIIYDVATSMNGYITGPNEDISAFPAEGDHVEAYLSRLAAYDTVLMGRGTYEFGFRFGLQPGQRAYPHMRHYIYSQSLNLPAESTVEVVRDHWIDHVKALKSEQGGDIYLCGGGRFAGLLMSHGLVDRLRLKVAPVLLPAGVTLFEHLERQITLEPEQVIHHNSNVVTMEYRVQNSGQ